MNYDLFASATSSPESASGPLPCDKQDGATTRPYGRVPALASLSARSAKERDLLTSGTCGRRSTFLSSSANLQSSLASRLRERTALAGSPLYDLTWTRRDTPSGQSIPALRASATRTSGNAFIGLLPTPAASECRDRARPSVLARLDKGGRLARWICSRSWKARTHEGVIILNPSFALWMMGLPEQWADCMERVTRSRSGKRKASSKQ